MKKFLIAILFFYILSLFQTSFFSSFSILGKIPNLILVSAVFFLLLENPKENFGFFVAGLGGFFIDIFSNYPLGTATIFLLFLAFVLKKISSYLQKITILWFSLSSILALILYNLFSDITFNLLPPSVFQINFGMLLSIELIYNFILLLAGFYLLYFFRNYVRLIFPKTP